MTNNQYSAAKNNGFHVIGQAIQTPWPGQCFGCSPTNRHSLRLRFYPTENGCLARCNIPEHYCGFDGIVHGGVTTTLLDEVAAWTMAMKIGQPGLTVKLEVHYYGPVPTETDLIVEGILLGRDEKSAFVRSTVYSEAGASLAEAESTWRLATLSRASQIMGVPKLALEQFFTSLRAEVELKVDNDAKR